MLPSPGLIYGKDKGGWGPWVISQIIADLPYLWVQPYSKTCYFGGIVRAVNV